MMNYILNAIVVAALVGTFVLAPAPQPSPPPAAFWPSEPSPVIDSAAVKAAVEAYGYSEVSAPVDGTGRVSTD